MKAQVESPNTTAATNSNVLGLRGQDGRVHKTKPRKEEENEEIKLYLAKLQELVPFMPKHKKLSKLEVIQYVIDYIRDLRQTLGMPPSVVPTSRIPSLLLNNSSCTPISNINHHLMDYVVNNNSPATTDLNASPLNTSSGLNSASSTHPHHRQPLGVISTPNNSSFIPSNNSTTIATDHHQNANQIPHQLMDKSPSSDIDTRPVSC